MIELHNGTFCSLVGYPTSLVVTMEKRGLLHGEWYLFIQTMPPGAGIEYHVRRGIFLSDMPVEELKRHGIANPQDVLVNELNNMARNTIMAMQFAAGEKKNAHPSWLTGVKEWTKADNWASELMLLRLRGLENKALVDMYKHTECNELSKIAEQVLAISPMQILTQ